MQSRTRQPRVEQRAGAAPAASPAWMRKKPAVVGSVVQPSSRRPATRRSRSATSSATERVVVLEVGERRDAGRLGAGVDAPGRGRGAQRRGQARRGDRVAETQAGEAPVLGHRVQHDEVAGSQRLALPLRLGQQVAVGLVEHEERVRVLGDQGGDQRRGQRRPGRVVGRAQPAEAGRSAARAARRAGSSQKKPAPSPACASGTRSSRAPASAVATSHSPNTGASARATSPGAERELRDQPDELGAAVAADDLLRARRRAGRRARPQSSRGARVRIRVDHGAGDRRGHARRRAERRLVGAEVDDRRRGRRPRRAAPTGRPRRGPTAVTAARSGRRRRSSPHRPRQQRREAGGEGDGRAAGRPHAPRGVVDHVARSAAGRPRRGRRRPASAAARRGCRPWWRSPASCWARTAAGAACGTPTRRGRPCP